MAIGVEHHHANRVTNIAHSKIIGGIVSSPEANERTFPVLDALANICISKPQGQVVAVALQLQSQQKLIRLSISENHAVPDDMVQHLTNVWKMLKRLSSQFAAQRIQPTESTANSQNQVLDVSPRMPSHIGRDLRIKIFQKIYCYTREKNRHRWDKWWPVLESFMARFYKKKANKNNFQGLEVNLDLAFKALKCAIVYDRRPPKEQDTVYWKELYSFIEFATSHVQTMTGNENYWCNRLAVETGKP